MSECKKYIYVRSHFGSRSILFDPTRIRSRIGWRNPPSGWIIGSGRGPVGPPLNLRRPLVASLVSTVLSTFFVPFGTSLRGSGQENFLVTKLLNLGIPYLALYLLQLAGSKLHWV